MQRLLIVSATYKGTRVLDNAAAIGGGKLCTTLAYGTREHFIAGLEDVFALSTLSLEDEWSRDFSWSDWKGHTYNMRNEFVYVLGPASAKVGCTPGTRDENNDGKPLNVFIEEVNQFIAARRRDGYGASLMEDDAFLSREEVVAIRLYTGPGFQPINNFLRQIAGLTGHFRRELIQHPLVTLAKTVQHICAAIRKLSAVATEEEATGMLWRGVRGRLPRGFWLPDETGVVCAVDMAFLSTSRGRETPIDYMGSDCDNVLWAIQPSRETDTGFHYGADVSMLSQFSSEQEVLFPPATMLEVLWGKEMLEMTVASAVPTSASPNGDATSMAAHSSLSDIGLSQVSTSRLMSWRARANSTRRDVFSSVDANATPSPERTPLERAPSERKLWRSASSRRLVPQTSQRNARSHVAEQQRAKRAPPTWLARQNTQSVARASIADELADLDALPDEHGYNHGDDHPELVSSEKRLSMQTVLEATMKQRKRSYVDGKKFLEISVRPTFI